MAVTINGDGTIGGVSVGGLPDGIVDTDMLAASAVNAGKIATSAVTEAKIADDAVTAAKLSYKGFVSYAIIGDQKTNSTNGGTFTSGAFRTRDLNTEFADPDGIVSISSNQFTLAAGTYFLRASAPALQVNRHCIRLHNVTDDSLVAEGITNMAASGSTVQTNALLMTRFTITGSKAFEIRHRSSLTNDGDGFGQQADVVASVSIYTVVEIFKEA